MERINIDDEFKDWIIGGMPLAEIIELYEIYKQINQPPTIKIKIEEAGLHNVPDVVFDTELSKLKDDLNNWGKKSF